LYSIRILKPAARELEKLDKIVTQRIVDKIRWLSHNIQSIKLPQLKGGLSGLFKIREGSYRIIFEIVYKEKTIIIHSIGHRKDIYKKK
jgi:mRNA interferase RelE/StbE